ncbi:unnamed protein product, partial [Anisakis simplex]|uniref:HTH CENPB-type domain-containing protein n=1 Tax=Anisakis simplex TaxID=6269 RepID=A0A0M3JGX8_ANISI
MERFSPAIVVALLVEKFGVDDASSATREEKKVAQRLVDIIARHVEGDELEVEEHEEVCSESEDDVEPSVNLDDGVVVNPDSISFSNGKVISATDVRRAIDYYRSPSDGCRPFSSMHNRFRFISNKNDMKRLREFERNEMSIVDRRNRIKALSAKLKETVIEKMGRGVILHDTDLRALAHSLNKEFRIPRFEASGGWIKKFKRANHFTSRRITKF